MQSPALEGASVNASGIVTRLIPDDTDCVFYDGGETFSYCRLPSGVIVAKGRIEDPSKGIELLTQAAHSYTALDGLLLTLVDYSPSKPDEGLIRVEDVARGRQIPDYVLDFLKNASNVNRLREMLGIKGLPELEGTLYYHPSRSEIGNSYAGAVLFLP